MLKPNEAGRRRGTTRAVLSVGEATKPGRRDGPGRGRTVIDTLLCANRVGGGARPNYHVATVQHKRDHNSITLFEKYHRNTAQYKRRVGRRYLLLCRRLFRTGCAEGNKKISKRHRPVSRLPAPSYCRCRKRDFVFYTYRFVKARWLITRARSHLFISVHNIITITTIIIITVAAPPNYIIASSFEITSSFIRWWWLLLYIYYFIFQGHHPYKHTHWWARKRARAGGKACASRIEGGRARCVLQSSSSSSSSSPPPPPGKHNNIFRTPVTGGE